MRVGWLHDVGGQEVANCLMGMYTERKRCPIFEVSSSRCVFRQQIYVIIIVKGQTNENPCYKFHFSRKSDI